MTDLFLVKELSQGTPDPRGIGVDTAMERDSRSVMIFKYDYGYYCRLNYTDRHDYWCYDYNWVIKLKRKECSQI